MRVLYTNIVSVSYRNPSYSRGEVPFSTKQYAIVMALSRCSATLSSVSFMGLNYVNALSCMASIRNNNLLCVFFIQIGNTQFSCADNSSICGAIEVRRCDKGIASHYSQKFSEKVETVLLLRVPLFGSNSMTAKWPCEKFLHLNIYCMRSLY